jgi:hypothetical protein
MANHDDGFKEAKVFNEDGVPKETEGDRLYFGRPSIRRGSGRSPSIA